MVTPPVSTSAWTSYWFQFNLSTQAPPLSVQLTFSVGAAVDWTAATSLLLDSAVLAASSCALCPPGTLASNATGAASCPTCPPGKVSSVPRSENCTACPENTYADSNQCLVCPHPFYTAPGSSDCTPSIFAQGDMSVVFCRMCVGESCYCVLLIISARCSRSSDSEFLS